MTPSANRDWRVILLAFGSAGAGLLSLALAAMTASYAVIGRLFGLSDPAIAEPWPMLIVASDLTLIAAVSLVAAYHSVQRLRGEIHAYSRPPALRSWFMIVLLVAWLVISLVASALVDRGAWQATLPLLHMLAISIPVYLLARIAINGLRGGSSLRLWGAVATGMLVGTGVAIVIEVSLLVLGASAGILFVALNPEHLTTLQRLTTQLGPAPSMEHVIEILGPVFTSPGAVILALFVVSGVIPIVEELAKSMSTWAIYDRLLASADGFWSGALSGAGFALLEGLMSSADPTPPWAFILLLRGGSSLMHIVASALAGWGIGSFRNGRGWGRLIVGYVVAMALHSAWNASIVGIGYGAIKATVDNNQLDPVGLASASAGGLFLALLIALLPIGLIILNQRLRASEVGDAALGKADAPGPQNSFPTEG